jgi:NAD-dependent dihydropyrimidine dehydrogenase PreA subunit
MSKRMLICRCTERQLLAPEALAATAAAARADGYEVLEVSDLCQLCATRDPALLEWVGEGELSVAACHPRAIRWLLHQAGIPPATPSLIDLRTPINSPLSPPNPPINQQPSTINSPLPLTPDPCHLPADPHWSPVIDYDRCTACKQCLSFCPFGVYSLSPAGDVAVTTPGNCKNNCPACARICPQMAIIFPKFKQGPISGEPVREEDVARVQAVLSEQAGGDLHELLAKRKLRAAYRKLEREATQQNRELTQDELAEAMATTARSIQQKEGTT